MAAVLTLTGELEVAFDGQPLVLVPLLLRLSPVVHVQMLALDPAKESCPLGKHVVALEVVRRDRVFGPVDLGREGTEKSGEQRV